MSKVEDSLLAKQSNWQNPKLTQTQGTLFLRI